MQIGVVPDPLKWDRWAEAEALLKPAQERGGFEEAIEPDEALYAVIEDGELLACATAWLSTERYVEIKLVGGRERHRWLAKLDGVIGAAAAEAGATQLVAIGRRGWLRELKRLGWDSSSEVDGTLVYRRCLGV